MGITVIYCRISKDSEGTQVGVDRQEQDCRALAARIGLTISEPIYIENDTGASTLSTKSRPKFEAMMRAAEAGQISTIIAYSNSRLTRRPLEMERLITAHDRTGVQFLTVVSGQDDLSTADGRMVARIKASVDAAESERIGERGRRAKQAARDKGEWLGGWRPYGFGPDGRTPRPAEAATIEECARAILDGKSVTSLVRNLNTKKIPTSTGKPWSTRTLRRVLQRPHPTIEAALTESVRLLLADPSRRTTPGPQRRWLLSGILRCGMCGAKMRGSASSRGKGQSTYPAYRCPTGKHTVINSVVLDEFISGIVVARMARPDAARAFSTPTVDTTALYNELALLRGRLDALADDLDIDERTLARRSRKLRDRIEQIEGQIAAASRSGLLGKFGRGRAAEAVWDEFDIDERREVVGLLMTITVVRAARGVVPMEHRWRPELPVFDPRRVVIEWNTSVPV